jgi:hypothetical protein
MGKPNAPAVRRRKETEKREGMVADMLKSGGK